LCWSIPIKYISHLLCIFKVNGKSIIFRLPWGGALHHHVILIFVLPVFNLIAQEDTDPPELVSLDFTPKTIDVSTGPRIVTFTVRFTDEVSGFDYGNVTLRSPSGQQSQGASFSQTNRISGDDKDGIYEFTISFPQYSESGTWYISYLYMRDKVGNRRNLPESDLITLGFPTELNVNENSPPVAVCKNISIDADETCQASITIEDVDGGSYDPDEGDTITLSLDNYGPFPLGENLVNLTVTDDSGESDTCEAVVTVVDTIPPVPDLAELPPLNGECFVEITSIPTATDNCSGIIQVTTTDPLVYGEQGIYTVTWTYDDGNGNIVTQTQTVTVRDVTPPEISVSVSPNILWPPNHKMVLITPTILASDNCNFDPVVELTSITMNEGDETNTYDPNYDTTLGDGKTTNDIQVDESGNIYLRAERSGQGTGRIYTITYTITDASGNTATAVATVSVPHDQ